MLTLAPRSPSTIIRAFDAPKRLAYRAFTTPDSVWRWWAGDQGCRDGSTSIMKRGPGDAAPLRSRIVEGQIASRLRTLGAVLIDGAKGVGKTTAARHFAASEVRLDQDRAARTAAQIDPTLVLDGEHPRLIDEYQRAPGTWNAVRRSVDDLRRKGLYLLTGSATPEDEPADHTGARRIAPVRMRTMTFHERGLCTGTVSLAGLLAGKAPPADQPSMTVRGAIDANQAEVRFYRDNKGLEVDAIVEARGGRWVGVEVKLGHGRVDEGAANLLATRGGPGRGSIYDSRHNRSLRP